MKNKIIMTLPQCFLAERDVFMVSAFSERRSTPGCSPWFAQYCIYSARFIALICCSKSRIELFIIVIQDPVTRMCQRCIHTVKTFV